MIKTKRSMVTVIFLLLVMLAASAPRAQAYSAPGKAEEQLQKGYSSDLGQYAVYPVPQWISYDNPVDSKEFILTKEINVVFESGIDSYTKDFLKEVLEKYGRTMQVSEGIVSGKSNILIGVNGSNESADLYAQKSAPVQNDSLFSENDGYLLNASNGTIVIVGKDTDAAFCGIATLQMMFSSFAGERFLNTQVEDYANLESRGFIEGFYGGWSYEGRESLMKFARDLKMNTYVYASKTDSYHKNDELYPQSELEQIRKLVETGKETKVDYAWSIHISYFFNRLNGMTVGSESYQKAFDDNYTKLKAKFSQLYHVGVRKFDILNDDFGSGTHSEVVRLLNKLDDDFLRPNQCKRMSYCPQGYNESWSSQQELEALKGLNPDIDLYWTGSDVNSPITQQTVDFLKSRTNHDPVFWINYPVNEHDSTAMFLGDITHYARSGVNGLAGGVSNPCRFTEANKAALFQLASLFWNNTDYESYAVSLWEEAFKYLQPEVYDAYFTIAKNVANCSKSGRVSGFPESEYLKENLKQIMEKAEAGEELAQDNQVQELLQEFNHIQNAIEIFRNNCKNSVLVSELNPWLDSLKDVTNAGKSSLEALICLAANDLDGAWGKLGIAGRAMDSQDSYPTYNGSGTSALAGTKRLVPFAAKMIVLAKNGMIPHLNPDATDFTPSFYGKLGGKIVGDSPESAKIFDGSKTTYGSYQVVQEAGDYFGIDMGRVIPVHSIEILQGKTDTDHDYFHNGALEYSKDGENWTVIVPEVDSRRIETKDIWIRARYIRLRLTQKGTAAKPDYWTFIREFGVNQSDRQGYTVYTNSEGLDEIPVTLEEKTYSLQPVGKAKLNPGEYLGIKLPQMTAISSVNAVLKNQDTTMELQYSENGVIWNELTDSMASINARYVRLLNHTEETVHFELNQFDVTAASIEIHPQVSESSFAQLKEGSWSNLFDDNLSTFAWTNTAQKSGQYIIVDLGAAAPVYDLKITTEDGNPRFYNAKIQTSVDKSNWEDIAVVTDGGGDAVRENIYYHITKNLDGKMVRYFRILITGDSGYYLKINEFAVNQTLQSQSSVLTGSISGDLSKMIDGNISSVYASNEPSDGTAYVRYQFTDQTKVKSVTILQDGEAITHAQVKGTFYDGQQVSEEILGNMDRGSSTFLLNGERDLLYLELTWPKGTLPVVYEIFTASGEQTAHPGEETVFPEGKHIYKLGQETFEPIKVTQGTVFSDLKLPGNIKVFYQDKSSEELALQWSSKGYDENHMGIYTLKGMPVLAKDSYNFAGLYVTVEVTAEGSTLPDIENGNLALFSPVEESGTGVHPCKEAVDGELSTRWEGAEIKGNGAQKESWLMVDLGNKPIRAESIQVQYYLKTYATDYEIQVSSDKISWDTIQTKTNQDGDTKDPIDTFILEEPIQQRYVRLVFRKMNQNAAGNAVGIRELEIIGSRGSSVKPDPEPDPDPTPDPVCTCRAEDMVFTGGSAVLNQNNPTAVFYLESSAVRQGDCQVEGHSETGIAYCYEILGGAGTIASLNGNMLTVIEPGTIQIQAEASIPGTQAVPLQAVAVFEVTREEPPVQIQYTASFTGGEGAVGNGPQSITALEGEKIRMPGNPYIKSGYEFEGWSDGTAVYPVNSMYTMKKREVVFTALWKANLPAKPAKVTGLKASKNSAASLALSWKRVSGAKGYVVYRYDGAKKKWKKAGAVSKTSFTDKKLKSGSVYKYKVQAYAQVGNNKAEGSFSSVLSTATAPNRPKLISVKSSSNRRITIKWAKSSGADGYVIYRKTGKDRYQKLTSKTAKIRSYTIKAPKRKISKKKSTYFFKIKSYKKLGKSKYYSSFSKEKSVRL